MKLKIKKSLMLTALASVTTLGVLTPVFTMSACGNKTTSTDTTTKPDQPSTPGGSGTDTPGGTDQPKPSQPEIINSGLNKGLPVNWTQIDLENAVNNYANSIKNISNDELVTSFNDMLIQMNKVNTSEEINSWINQFATFTPMSHDADTGKILGGWT